MNKTVEVFKKQQMKALEILNKLDSFIKFGEELGVKIDNELKIKLLNAINEIETKKLKVALVGGFSEGKTSIAAAWLEKLDQSSMKISHQESSDEVKVYEVGDDIELIDTPGLFGFKEKVNADTQTIEKYKEITKKYISEAHLVLYVMNSINPIKESHKEDLNWLFRTLNLLHRTIFVLSKFDEVADIADDEEYLTEYEIKRNNIINRLNDLIDLNENEIKNLSIVAVSANPFGEGIDYWLSNQNEYKRLSHISKLQEETNEKIKYSGGTSVILYETKKTIIKDVLYNQLPIAQRLNQKIIEEIEKLEQINNIMKKDLDSFEPKISEIKINLREFVKEYFTDLIMQVEGTSLNTVSNFIEKEIGSEGININIKIQNEFERQIGIVNYELQKIEVNFNAEVDSFNKTIRAYGKEGLNYLSKSQVVNKDTVLIARDTIVKGAKVLGVDLSKYLKFKPWGATKFAKGANVAFAVIGLGIELWDSWEKARQEEEFKKAVKEMKSNFEKQKKEIIEMINSEYFISNFFPIYIELKNNYEEINKSLNSMKEHQQMFIEWEKMGEVIEAEFSEI